MDTSSGLSERQDAASALFLSGSKAYSTEFVRVVTSLMQAWSGCDAVGLRLRLGCDYPYFEYRGFSERFILEETRLCAVGEQGRPVLDGDGEPFLECMCGSVIAGRTDPGKPFFTPYGSFWTNSTTDLLACTREEDRQGRTRNRCNTAGYESVALVPLRWEGETFGLMQFNDRRIWRFTPERISLLESLAEGVAGVLARWGREEPDSASKESVDLTCNFSDKTAGDPSHTLLTPLNVIIGFTDLLLDGSDGPLTSEQRHSLRRILASAHALEGLLMHALETHSPGRHP